jgi:peptidoglycan/xylan/chitin deacetylase (PgdA/CDA1 family)
MPFSTIAARIQNRYRRAASVLGCRQPVDIHPKHPLISFTFDDFPQSAGRIGSDILRGHGFHATYYVSLGLMDRDIPAGRAFSKEDLHHVVQEGHELGCHTFSHCDSWETEPELFEKSVFDNKVALERILPETSFKTLSYPISCPRPQTKRRMRQHFLCCRGGGRTLKLTSKALHYRETEVFNTGKVDAYNLQTYFLEKSPGDVPSIKRLIEENTRLSGWLIFGTHDVTSKHTSLGCSPDFFENIVCAAANSGAKVLPVAEAWTLLTGNSHPR